LPQQSTRFCRKWQTVELSIVATAAALRTSIYFDRKVHDQLRAIAFEERKSVAGVIHDAIDDFLRKRGFPTTEGAEPCKPGCDQAGISERLIR
jgi:hypothetical protein